MPYALIIQAALSMAGQLISLGQRDKAQQLLDSVRARYEGIQLPSARDLEAQAAQAGPSAMESVQADPQAVGAQRKMLSMALQRAAGGYDAQDEAALMGIDQGINSTARHARDSIEQNMAARGGIGSGADYAMQAAAAQDAGQRAAMSGAQVKAQALQRAMQAMGAASGMAGQMRGQQSEEDARRAAAADAIARQNASYRQQAAMYNAQNPARAAQLQMQQAGGIAGATNGSVNQMNGTATQTNGMYQSLGGSVADAGTAINANTANPYPSGKPRPVDAYGDPTASSADEWNPWPT